MIVFAIAIAGYRVYAGGTYVGFWSHNGNTYRIINDRPEFVGKMTREHAQNYFEGIFG